MKKPKPRDISPAAESIGPRNWMITWCDELQDKSLLFTKRSWPFIGSEDSWIMWVTMYKFIYHDSSGKNPPEKVWAHYKIKYYEIIEDGVPDA